MTEPFALTNGMTVTGDADGTVLPEMTVVVDAGGMIAHVGPTTVTQVPAGYRTLDVTGRFVTPGLINAHAHLFAVGKPLGAQVTRTPFVTAERAAVGKSVE